MSGLTAAGWIPITHKPGRIRDGRSRPYTEADSSRRCAPDSTQSTANSLGDHREELLLSLLMGEEFGLPEDWPASKETGPLYVVTIAPSGIFCTYLTFEEVRMYAAMNLSIPDCFSALR